MIRTKYLLALTAVGCAACVDSPDTGAPDDRSALDLRLRQLAAPYVDPAGVPGKAVGLVVGVSSPRGRTVVGVGATLAGGAVQPGANTVFEIGSVTKVYTGALLGLEVHRGRLQLSDSIDPFFPSGTPHYGRRSISLLDLATHTSGLPNMPTNLQPSMPGNPAAGYTAADLERFLSSYVLSIEPSTTFGYSNVGAGTLGYALVRRTSSPDYDALIKREIADPLGLQDTTTALTAEQRSRRAQGYSNGQPAPENDIGEPLKGSGALRSTGSDVLAFVEGALGTGTPDVVAAWQRVVEPQRPSPLGQNGRTGLLLNIEELQGRTVYSKNGQTAGFSSQILFTRAPPAAVVVLTNSRELADGSALRDLGLAILASLE